MLKQSVHVITLSMPLLTFGLVGGCAAPMQFLSQSPTVSETLEGNYRTLAACTFERLARQPYRARRSEQQAAVRMGPESGEWEMSFIDDAAGRLTRLEMKSPGTQASDYALALARACAA